MGNCLSRNKHSGMQHAFGQLYNTAQRLDAHGVLRVVLQAWTTSCPPPRFKPATQLML
jgi:hypothetical protein